jgi:PBP1b-binding outer membrane lipoprotein LpoB
VLKFPTLIIGCEEMFVTKSLTSVSVIVVAAVFLTGCGAELNLPEYSKAPLPKTVHMPSKSELTGHRAKVIMMPLDNNELNVAQKAKLGNSMITKVNSELAEAKSVKIVKRVKKSSYSQLLSKEIAASELSKELGTDVGQADFIITGQISNATYNHTFTEGYNYECKDSNGNIRTCYAPPRMSYKSCVEGNVKVFQLPTLSEAFSKPFSECSSTSTQVRSSREVVRENDGLVRKAGLEAADSVAYPLKNFFAAKGYIYEQRVKDDEKILKTSLGLKEGAIKGAEVNIYSIIDDNNALTGNTTLETVKIGEGTVSNQITSGSSWIIVNKMYNSYTPKAGDYVKIVQKESIWSKGLKLIN